MNDICEMWNLPWHALQKSLAQGLSEEMIDGSLPVVGSVYVQSAAVAALSWLSRARLRATPSAIERR